MGKKFQIAKVYQSGRFKGYGIAVDGELIECQLSTVIDTEPGRSNLNGDIPYYRRTSREPNQN